LLDAFAMFQIFVIIKVVHIMYMWMFIYCYFEWIFSSAHWKIQLVLMKMISAINDVEMNCIVMYSHITLMIIHVIVYVVINNVLMQCLFLLYCFWNVFIAIDWD
jgi:hypothetical protein